LFIELAVSPITHNYQTLAIFDTLSVVFPVFPLALVNQHAARVKQLSLSVVFPVFPLAVIDD
jgi:hypothetical protein